MVEKFDNKDVKNGNFINQLEFRKKFIKDRKKDVVAVQKDPFYQAKALLPK